MLFTCITHQFKFVYGCHDYYHIVTFDALRTQDHDLIGACEVFIKLDMIRTRRVYAP